MVVAADVGGLALDGDHFGDDLFVGGGELRRDGGEAGLEFGVSGLGGEGLGPVQAEIKMAAAVVDAGADLARGTLVEGYPLLVDSTKGSFAGSAIDCLF